MAVTKIGRQSLTGQITDLVRQRIISGQLPAGTPLRQEKLAAELGVSRVPLREAIRQLEAEGLVVSELHKGTVVSSLSREELEELFELRVQLETWLFSLAIPRMTEADFALADAVLAETAAKATVETWGDYNWRFHSSLLAPSGRSMALKQLQTFTTTPTATSTFNSPSSPTSSTNWSTTAVCLRSRGCAMSRAASGCCAITSNMWPKTSFCRSARTAKPLRTSHDAARSLALI